MKKILPILLTLLLIFSLCFSSCDVVFTPDGPATGNEETFNEETNDGESTNGESADQGSDSNDSSCDDETQGSESSTDGEAPDKETSGDKDGDESNDIAWDSDTPAEDDSTPPSDGTDDEDDTNGEKETDGGLINEDHSDADDNGICDDCGESVVIILDLFAINDLHGKFADTSTQIGVDEMTTYIKNAYKNEDHVIFLSSGDMWQGSSESNLTKGNIITEWLNYLDVVSMTIGNHEYDWGEEYIAQNAALAEFPFLAINVYDSDTNERAEYCQPSVMVQRGGAIIGIIGAVGDCYSSISGEVSDGFYFKTGSDLTNLVKAEAQRLREAGADYIIYSIHDGHGSSSSGVGSISDSSLRSYYDPSLSEGYVDIVFEAHSHQRYVLRDGDGVYHIQGGGDNKGISHAEVKINFANGNNSVLVAELVSSSVYENLADDPIVDTLMDKYADQVSIGTRVLGMNDTYLSSDAVCSLVAELYVKAGVEMFGDQYNIVLGGGFLSTRSPYNLSAGQVTYSQLQMILPFDNELVLCSIKGSDLLSKFINTSNSNYFISYSDYGNSIKGSINSNAIYYVIVDTYTSTYSYNRLTEVARYTPEVYARDLLAAYIEEGGLTSGNGEISYTSIPEILSIGEKLSSGGQTTVSYYVKGKVTSITNTTYGNLYIEDEQGNSLYVYGVYDSTGSLRYDSLSNPPKVGDEICLYGQIKKYVSVSENAVIIEMIKARLIN